MKLELDPREVQHIDAEALLLPVDGSVPNLGSGAGKGLRAALPPDERIEELEYVESMLHDLRGLVPGQARRIDGVARWKAIVVAAAYPHDVDGRLHTPDDCARLVRAGVASAVDAAVEGGLASLALTMIGTQYRMPRDLAVRAIADALAQCRSASITVAWSLPDAADRAAAEAACKRLGLMG
jgi:O-acetyl-ADP-ribose deacetylase (regulator of RNase III)